MPLNHTHKQVIYGSLLGNASIIRNYFTFVSRDFSWIQYKAYELNEFANEKPFIKTTNRLKWRTKQLPIFDEIKPLFYLKNKKIVQKEVLEQLTDLGLAIWFGDKGFWNDKHKIGLRTSTFGVKGNKIIVNYFNSLGIECFLRKIPNTARTIFTEKGTQTFLKIVAPVLPQFMWRLLSY